MKLVIALILMHIGLTTNLDYSFDYRLEYEFTNFSADSTSVQNYYVNTKNNSYYANIKKSKIAAFDFYFRDQDKLTAFVKLSGNYKNPGTLVLNDSLTYQFNNVHEYKAKNYEIVNLKDTLINDKVYAQVIFKMINQKKAKRKKIATHIYIIDTTVNTKPLLTDPTILNIYRRSKKNMPNGLIIEKLVYDSKGELNTREKLTEFTPVNFAIQIREN